MFNKNTICNYMGWDPDQIGSLGIEHLRMIRMVVKLDFLPKKLFIKTIPDPKGNYLCSITWECVPRAFGRSYVDEIRISAGGRNALLAEIVAIARLIREFLMPVQEPDIFTNRDHRDFEKSQVIADLEPAKAQHKLNHPLGWK